MTARTAADLLEIQPNTDALFYHKIRQVISYHLALEAHEIFEGKIEARAILVVIEREKEGVEPQERWRFLGC